MAGWITACPDWEARLLAGRSLVPDLPLFAAERDRALRVFNRLRLADVFGKPPWPRPPPTGTATSSPPCSAASTPTPTADDPGAVPPGAQGQRQDHLRRHHDADGDHRQPAPDAEFLLVAPTLNIAERAYGAVAGAIKADPSWRRSSTSRTTARPSPTGATTPALAIKAADTDVITGSIATGTLIDETHVFATKPRAAAVFVELRGALGKRPDGFLIQITTQSKEPPAGVFKNELAIAREVRDGKLPWTPPAWRCSTSCPGGSPTRRLEATRRSGRWSTRTSTARSTATSSGTS
jgi:hypothetical protein